MNTTRLAARRFGTEIAWTSVQPFAPAPVAVTEAHPPKVAATRAKARGAVANPAWSVFAPVNPPAAPKPGLRNAPYWPQGIAMGLVPNAVRHLHVAKRTSGVDAGIRIAPIASVQQMPAAVKPLGTTIVLRLRLPAEQIVGVSLLTAAR